MEPAVKSARGTKPLPSLVLLDMPGRSRALFLATTDRTSDGACGAKQKALARQDERRPIIITAAVLSLGLPARRRPAPTVGHTHALRARPTERRARRRTKPRLERSTPSPAASPPRLSRFGGWQRARGPQRDPERVVHGVPALRRLAARRARPPLGGGLLSPPQLSCASQSARFSNWSSFSLMNLRFCLMSFLLKSLG